MKIPMKAGGSAVAVVAIAVILAGCGSDSKTVTASSASPSSSSSSASKTSSAAPSTKAAGANQTIADYLKQNGISETPVKRGDPGSPTINLPVPDGWVDAGAKTPEYAYGAIVFTGDPAAAADPPAIIAIMSKLTGQVDPAMILKYAPGELKNLPGFEGGPGRVTKLGGFDAYQIGGTYVRDGVMRLIAQKTVVIPGQDALFVLQINADGVEARAGALMEATAEIDKETTITP